MRLTSWNGATNCRSRASAGWPLSNRKYLSLPARNKRSRSRRIEMEMFFFPVQRTGFMGNGFRRWPPVRLKSIKYIRGFISLALQTDEKLMLLESRWFSWYFRGVYVRVVISDVNTGAHAPDLFPSIFSFLLFSAFLSPGNICWRKERLAWNWWVTLWSCR